MNKKALNAQNPPKTAIFGVFCEFQEQYARVVLKLVRSSSFQGNTTPIFHTAYQPNNSL